LQLLDALEWCLDLGITCVSAYAFSIDNFKRPKDEVDMLMKLAEEKLEDLLHVRSTPQSTLQLLIAMHKCSM
jgi:ditrans,polycis-polyprenyl diphosphate synthase